MTGEPGHPLGRRRGRVPIKPIKSTLGFSPCGFLTLKSAENAGFSAASQGPLFIVASIQRVEGRVVLHFLSRETRFTRCLAPGIIPCDRRPAHQPRKITPRTSEAVPRRGTGVPSGPGRRPYAMSGSSNQNRLENREENRRIHGNFLASPPGKSRTNNRSMNDLRQESPPKRVLIF